VADKVYSIGRKIIWIVAGLTALPELGISPWPAVVVAGCSCWLSASGAREMLRDVYAGLQIVMEDQFVAGDTIQAGDTVGRVEQLTCDAHWCETDGARWYRSQNGEMRTVSNLSRDWSQAFVDIGVGAAMPLEKTLQVLENAAAELRSDGSLVAGIGGWATSPRRTSIRSHWNHGSFAVRTVPTRQDEVCRELRRRVQMELQRQGIAVATGT